MKTLPVLQPLCCGPDTPPMDAPGGGGPRRGFKALADPTRVAIVNRLARGSEVCVCDLTAAFDLSQPTVSHHLRILRDAGLVEAQRRGHVGVLPARAGGDRAAARRFRRGELDEQLAQGAELVGYDAEVGPAAALLALDEAGFEQHLQVVADRRLGQLERFGQVADAGLAGRAGTGSGSAGEAGWGRRGP